MSNLYENYEELNYKELMKIKDDLIKKKSELINEQRNIDISLNNIKNQICLTCKEEFKEHKWKKEKEYCMYGETYIFCSRCGKDKFSDAIY